MIASFTDVYHIELVSAVVEVYDIRVLPNSEIIYTQTENGTDTEKRFFWELSWKARYWLNQNIKDAGYKYLMFRLPPNIYDGMRYYTEPEQDELQSLAESEFLQFIEQMQ